MSGVATLLIKRERKNWINCSALNALFVMPGLVPGIHVFNENNRG
jgi:hypothetical protein